MLVVIRVARLIHQTVSLADVVHGLSQGGVRARRHTLRSATADHTFGGLPGGFAGARAVRPLVFGFGGIHTRKFGERLHTFRVDIARNQHLILLELVLVFSLPCDFGDLADWYADIVWLASSGKLAVLMLRVLLVGNFVRERVCAATVERVVVAFHKELK